MRAAFACGVALTLTLASVAAAVAQPAPENRSSMTMQKNGGHSGLNQKAHPNGGVPAYVHTYRYRGMSFHYRFRHGGHYYYR